MLEDEDGSDDDNLPSDSEDSNAGMSTHENPRDFSGYFTITLIVLAIFLVFAKRLR